MALHKGILRLVGSDRLRPTKPNKTRLQRALERNGFPRATIASENDLREAALNAADPKILGALAADLEEFVTIGTNPAGRRVDQFFEGKYANPEENEQ